MRFVIAVLTLSMYSGCATVAATYFEGPTCYGGVKADYAALTSEDSTDTELPMPQKVATSALLLGDLPLSAVADTLLLPFWLVGVKKSWSVL